MTTVIGFLGTQLDNGITDKRWERWRPSVGLVAHEDFPVDRFEMLLSSEAHRAIAEQVIADIAIVSPRTEVRVHVLDVPDPWNFPAMYAALHAFAKTFPFVEDETYFVHLATGTHVAQICLFLLTEARYFPAKLLESSFSKQDEMLWRGRLSVVDLELSNYDLLCARFRQEQTEGEHVLKAGIPTRNSAFNALITRIEKVCLRSDAPMLLTGPTGAGKSQLASRIYALRRTRRRLTGLFVEVNCATLRGDNAMSALFGHCKGAFTGAATERPGLLKSAEGGMLFLDEIGELGLDEQAMLLRALEEKSFLPLGSDVPVSSDFQLIAGTNRDLVADVRAGRFRADLFARINTWVFCLPGLAARPEDIEPNIDVELARLSDRMNSNISFNAAARDAYLRFALTAPWPGNFRDLAASIMRMATLAEGGRILPKDVADEIGHLSAMWLSEPVQGDAPKGALPPCPPASPNPLASRVLGEDALAQDLFDLAQLEAVLEVVGAARSAAEAGRTLFAVSREQKRSVNDSDRLRKYLAGWGLDFETVRRVLAVNEKPPLGASR